MRGTSPARRASNNSQSRHSVLRDPEASPSTIGRQSVAHQDVEENRRLCITFLQNSLQIHVVQAKINSSLDIQKKML